MAKKKTLDDLMEKVAREYENSTVASNCDHVINQAVVERLKTEEGFEAEHPAWNFFGRVTFENGKFVERVMRYGVKVAEISGDTYEEVFAAVNKRFGSD